MVAGVVGPHRRRADPLVPVEPFGYRRPVARAGHSPAGRSSESGSSRRGPRGPCPARPTRSSRRSAGPLRWPGRSCPSAWRPWPRRPRGRSCGPRKPNGSAAFGNARACPSSGPSSSPPRGHGPAWPRSRRRCPCAFPASCDSRHRVPPWETPWRCSPVPAGPDRRGRRCYGCRRRCGCRRSPCRRCRCRQRSFFRWAGSARPSQDVPRHDGESRSGGPCGHCLTFD